ncbi:MAG TPA: Rid family detoxifying hydrolase [Aggregatilineales bacterium]|nr:Rid family detoxifying hydrolase [Aggregatilineales bacterium]
MSKEIVVTDAAPAAIGPYSQGIVASGRMVFVSGQLGIDPAVGKLVDGGVESQARRALTNIQSILAAAGATLADVVKTTVLLHDINDYKAVNVIYAEFFVENPPARAAFG